MNFKELETQLLSLNPQQRADAIQILVHKLRGESRGITRTSEVMGGNACIANTCLPVWLFVSLRSKGATDADILSAYPHLLAADLVNVWAYADAHPEEIAMAIQEHDETNSAYAKADTKLLR
jgi:uncharacterized protein (DUF433 family)